MSLDRRSKDNVLASRRKETVAKTIGQVLKPRKCNFMGLDEGFEGER